MQYQWIWKVVARHRANFWVEVVDLMEWTLCEETFSTLHVINTFRKDPQIFAVIILFESLLAKVWILLNDPSGGGGPQGVIRAFFDP